VQEKKQEMETELAKLRKDISSLTSLLGETQEDSLLVCSCFFLLYFGAKLHR